MKMSRILIICFLFLAASRPCHASDLAQTSEADCARNLRLIYDALGRFQAEHNAWPEKLSDLAGRYLAPEILICPVCRTTGAYQVRDSGLVGSTSDDPETVYKWELNASQKCRGMESKTWRALKLRQRETAVGDAVPIVRCDQHTVCGVPTHLNLTFGGDIFPSGPQWEEEFRDTLSSLYLLAPKLIFADVRRIPDRVEARPSKASDSQLDLGPVATALPSDPWQDGASDDTFGDLLALRDLDGLFYRQGTAFDIRALVQLDGRKAINGEIGRAELYYPTSPISIKVGRPARRLHLLGGAVFPSPEGSEIGGIRIKFANGDTQLIPWRYGLEVRDGWHDEKTGPEGANLVWHSSKSRFVPRFLPHREGSLKVYQLQFDIKESDQAIVSLEFYSSADAASVRQFPSGPFLLSATLE